MSISPFAQNLLFAIQELWSGMIEVTVDGEKIGQIVFSEGRVAWATCRGQSETLGVFLWRLGRLTKEQLEQVQKIFEKHKGRKKLGAIVEELGFMNTPVLRRCLLLHTRTAVEKLLSYPNAKGSLTPAAPRTDEKNLFGPEEVLPSSVSVSMHEECFRPDTSWGKSWRMRTDDNAILGDLIALPGHLASAIISADGGVITAYITLETVDPSLVSAFLAGMMESASRTVTAMQMGDIDHLMIDCSKGWLAIRWLDEERQRLLFVLLDHAGNPSLTRLAMKQAAPNILAWLLDQEIKADAPAAPVSPVSKT